LLLCGVADALQIPDVGSRSSIEVFQPVRAASVKVFDRGVTRTTINFTVTKEHATLAEARTWQFLHLAFRRPFNYARSNSHRVSKAGVLHIDNPVDSGPGNRIIYMKGGFESVTCKAIGVTTISNYAFVGGEPDVQSMTPDPI
jgi:hypothetical protein